MKKFSVLLLFTTLTLITNISVVKSQIVESEGNKHGLQVNFKKQFDDIYKPKIEEILNKSMELDLFSGCILIAKDDQVLFSQAYGEANKDWHIQNTLDTKFNIASGTKPFTGVSIMLLAQRGMLSIYDPVIKYLPDFPFGDKITIYHCLTHTSGLGHYTQEYNERMHTIRGFDSFLQEFIYKEKLLFEPGTQFSYSNSGVVVLGAIIENVLGMNYAEFLQKNIFDPLVMKNTCCKMSEDVIENRASGYQHKISGGYKETSLIICPPTSATGLKTTVGDLFKFLQAINKNTLLSEDTKKIMLTPNLNDKLGSYALLWDTYDSLLTKGKSCKIIGHNGGQPGFSSFYFNYLDLNYTVIVLSNYDIDMYIPATIERILFDKKYSLPRISNDQKINKYLYQNFSEKGYNEVFKNISGLMKNLNLEIDNSSILNDAGYNLINEGDIDMAINFFQLNIELFPSEADVYDSMGETLMKKGNIKLAIENYEKALQINPNYENAEIARSMIKKYKAPIHKNQE
jgi:CubicO group peptidase (beta-lactamase class C family)